MPSFIFAAGRRLAASTGLRWADNGAKFGALLTDGTYVPDPAKHRSVADVNGELSGTGYERKRLEGRELATSDEAAMLSAETIEWKGMTGGQLTAWLVLFAEGPTDRERPLLAAYPFKVLASGDVEVRWSNQKSRGVVLRIG